MAADDTTPAPGPDEEPARAGLKLRLEARLGLLDPVQLQVFRSYGTPARLCVHGRVTERKAVSGTTRRTSTWRNILDTVHRLESDEIPGARVRAHLQGRHWDAVTDAEGYFAFELPTQAPLTPGWHEVALELVETVGTPERRVERVQVLVPPLDADFGVISDLDDTVITTHSTDLLQTIVTVFGGGALDRAVVPGVPALYRALARGANGRGDNPIFYVSRSTWNLYDLFEEFLDLHGLPRGPTFLRDQRIVESPSRVMRAIDRKFDVIHTLLRTYPAMRFLLVGDSGMQDPELYEGIVHNHPGRILGVYIHDVSPSGRDAEVARIAESLGALGVPMVRAGEMTAAAEHAAAQGWIDDDGRREVHAEVEADRADAR